MTGVQALVAGRVSYDGVFLYFGTRTSSNHLLERSLSVLVRKYDNNHYVKPMRSVLNMFTSVHYLCQGRPPGRAAGGGCMLVGTDAHIIFVFSGFILVPRKNYLSDHFRGTFVFNGPNRLLCLVG